MIENRTTPRNSKYKSSFTFSRCAALLILLLLALNAPAIYAQQGTAIQPCPISKSPGRVVEKTASSETQIDGSIPDDPALDNLVRPYRTKVLELTNVIGKLDTELSKTGIGGGTLGNFVTDAFRTEASRHFGHPIPMMITNNGGLRKSSIAAGDLTAATIFELLPFENALIRIDLTGEQLKRLLAVVVKERDAQSGARIRYRTGSDNRPEFVSAKLLTPDGREVEIQPQNTYSVVTIDYLLNLSSGSYSILQEGKNVTRLGISMRDAMLEYIKTETAAGRTLHAELDGRFVSLDHPPSVPEHGVR